MNITFQDLVSVAGVVIAGGIITALVELVKTAFPVVDAKISGAAMAFIASAALYIVTGAALASMGAIVDPNGMLNVFLAWLAAATSAVGIKSTWAHVTA